MKTRDTIILLVVVALIGLFIIIYERNLPTTGEQKERQGRVLAQYDRENVTRVSIESEGRAIVLVRGQGDAPWRLVSPIEAEADAALVDGLLSDLEFMGSDRKVEDATSAQRKSFGLVSPSVQVEITQDGKPLRFVLGARAEAGGYYLAIDGDDTVHVVDETAVESLLKKPGEYREKRLLGSSGGSVEGIRITYQDGTTVRLDGGSGKWSLSVGDGPAERASQKAATAVSRSLSTLRSLEFIEDGVDEKDWGKKGFSSTPPTVHFETEEGSSGTLIFGESCEASHEDAAVKALLSPGGTLMCVGLAARDTIMTPLSDLRLTSPIEVSPFEVGSIESRIGSNVTLRLERDDQQGWIITAPGENRQAEPSAVEAYLDLLNASKTRSYAPLPVDLATVGLDARTASEIIILDVAGTEAEHLWLGRGPDQSMVFRRDGEPVYGTIEADPLLVDASHAWAFLARSVVSRDYFEASRFKVEGPVSHELTKHEGAWSFVLPEGMIADGADVRDTVETLCGLQAVRFVGAATAETLDAHGLAKPQWTIEVTFADPTAESMPPLGDQPAAGEPGSGDVVRLLIGNETEDGRAALLDGSGIDAVFVVSSLAFDRLTRPLADKGVFASAARDATQMSVFVPNLGTDTFGVKAGVVDTLMQGCKTPDPGSVCLGLERAKTLYSQLSALRAARVYSYAVQQAPVLMRITLTSGADTTAVISITGTYEHAGQKYYKAHVDAAGATYGLDLSLLDGIEIPGS
jgi:hypothetical protein